MNEAQLSWIRAAKAGDQEAFACLVREHKDFIFRTAFAIMRDRADAEDVVQEAFVKAYVSLPSLKNERAFGSWLATIATRLALDAIRRRRPDMQASDSDGGAPVDQIAAPETAPDLRLDLAAALAQLSPEHRAVVALRELQGFDYKEISEILGIPIGTVRSRLHAARMQLRALLRAYGERG